jgi:hypothetical protein
MWNLVLVRLETVLVCQCKIGTHLRQTYQRLRNHFRRTQWYSEVMRPMWKLVLVRLEIFLVLTQDRCMFCAEYTIGSEIILDTPNGTLCDMGHVKSRFGLFGDNVSVAA